MHKYFAWFHLPGALVLTSLMSLLAIVLLCVRPSLPRLLGMFGMLFWSFGDIILMNYTPITRHLPFHGLAAGGSAFCVGHLFFFAAFVIEMVRNKMPFFNAGVLLALGIWLLCCVALYVFKRPYWNKSLFPLFCAYLFMLTLLGVASCSCAFSMGGRFILAAVGFVLFLLSDEAIGLDQVSGIIYDNWNDVIWTLYPIGVILVVLGV